MGLFAVAFKNAIDNPAVFGKIPIAEMIEFPARGYDDGNHLILPINLDMISIILSGRSRWGACPQFSTRRDSQRPDDWATIVLI